MRIVKLASSSNPLLISARFTGRIIVFVALATIEHVNAADRVIDMRDAKEVIQAYLRATYARDFLEAYRFISAEDRKVRDVNRYVQQRGAFSGFTLEVAENSASRSKSPWSRRRNYRIALDSRFLIRFPIRRKLAHSCVTGTVSD